MKTKSPHKIVTLPYQIQAGGMIRGKIVEVDSTGCVLVNFLNNSNGPMKAAVTHTVMAELHEIEDVTSLDVLVAFENNDVNAPLILGILYSHAKNLKKQRTNTLESNKFKEIKVDGKRITIEGENEIELRCGESHILMTKDKVVIHSKNIKSQAARRHKIKGGTVKIN